jgi:protein transport protein SEC31
MPNADAPPSASARPFDLDLYPYVKMVKMKPAGIHLTWTCILVLDLYAATTFDARHEHRVWPASECDAPRHGTSGAPQSPYNRAVAVAPRGSRCAPPSVGRGGGRSGAARRATDRLLKEGGRCRPAGPGAQPPRVPLAGRPALRASRSPGVPLPGRPSLRASLSPGVPLPGRPSPRAALSPGGPLAGRRPPRRPARRASPSPGGPLAGRRPLPGRPARRAALSPRGPLTGRRPPLAPPAPHARAGRASLARQRPRRGPRLSAARAAAPSAARATGVSLPGRLAPPPL